MYHLHPRVPLKNLANTILKCTFFWLFSLSIHLLTSFSWQEFLEKTVTDEFLFSPICVFFRIGLGFWSLDKEFSSQWLNIWGLLILDVTWLSKPGRWKRDAIFLLKFWATAWFYNLGAQQKTDEVLKLV